MTAGPQGESCLAELEQREEIGAWMQENGRPDYVEQVEGDVRLFYIATDRVVTFSGGLFGGEPKVQTRIRSADHMRFRNEDRARLGVVRMRDVAGPPDEADDARGVVRRRVGQDR